MHLLVKWNVAFKNFFQHCDIYKLVFRSVKMSEKQLTKEEIIEGFDKLRQEQRSIATNIAKLEGEKTEHGVVIEALNKVEPGRTCHRLVGGVLVERTVGEVLPALTKNLVQISTMTDALNRQLIEKGKSLTAYREKFNIKVRGEAPAAGGGGGDPGKSDSAKPQSAPGVLVPGS